MPVLLWNGVFLAGCDNNEEPTPEITGPSDSEIQRELMDKLSFSAIAGGNATITGIKPEFEAAITNLVLPTTLEVNYLENGVIVVKSHPIVGIGENAFLNKTSITSVTIPDSFQSIGANAFTGCINIGAVTLGRNATTAFNGTTAGTTIFGSTSGAPFTNANFKINLPDDESIARYINESNWSQYIRGVDISKATIETISPPTFNNTQHKPTPTVTFAGIALTATTHFTYAYGTNTNAGTNAGSVTIAGAGSYYGSSKSTNFTINRANQTATGTLTVTSFTDNSVTVTDRGAGYEYSTNGTTWQSSNTFTGLARGSYTLRTRLAETQNYNASTNSITTTGTLLSVTLNKNDGTGGTDIISAVNGFAMLSISNPTYTGWTFNGYWDAITGGTQYYNSSGTSYNNWNKTSATTLYARWTRSITMNAQSGTSVSNITVTWRNATPTLATSTRSGYVYNGWNTATSGGNSVTAGDTWIWNQGTLYAQWLGNMLSITYSANGGSGSAPSLTYATYNSSVTMPACTYSRSNYAFTGWLVSGANSIAGTYTAGTSRTVSQLSTGILSGNAIITLTAQWVGTYTVTYHVNTPAGFSASGSTATTTHQIGTRTALGANGFNIANLRHHGWSTSSEGDLNGNYAPSEAVNLSTTPGENINLYAIWGSEGLSFQYDTGLNGIRIWGDGPTTQTALVIPFAWAYRVEGVSNTMYLVRSIRDSAFSNRTNFTSLILPWALINIGNYAFSGCTGFRGNLTLPNVMAIGYSAFSGCSGFTGNLTFDSFLKTIESSTFSGCSGLTGVTIPWNITSIGSSAFSGCSGFTGNLTIPYNVTTLSSSAFSNCSGLTSLTFGSGFTSMIGGNAFSGCSNLGDITVGKSATSNNPFNGTTAGSTIFGSTSTRPYTNSNFLITVPSGSESYYIAASGWTTYKDKIYQPSSGGGCVTPDTLITLADGTQTAVENLTGEEMLLVWNMFTGEFDSAPILFVWIDEVEKEYDVIKLLFSDGTELKVIYEHALFDFNLMEYVYIREDAAQYLGHWFNKAETDSGGGEMTWKKVQLVDVSIEKETTTSWSPIVFGHLCLYVNGMLSMPADIEGFFNIFEIDPETMMIDMEKYQEDIDAYGLFTYADFEEYIPEIIYEAFQGQYLSVAIGKGLITWEGIFSLIEQFSEYWVE